MASLFRLACDDVCCCAVLACGAQELPPVPTITWSDYLAGNASWAALTDLSRMIGGKLVNSVFSLAANGVDVTADSDKKPNFVILPFLKDKADRKLVRARAVGACSGRSIKLPWFLVCCARRV